MRVSWLLALGSWLLVLGVKGDPFHGSVCHMISAWLLLMPDMSAFRTSKRSLGNSQWKPRVADWPLFYILEIPLGLRAIAINLLYNPTLWNWSAISLWLLSEPLCIVVWHYCDIDTPVNRRLEVDPYSWFLALSS